jgi:EmrB/QacA subfamily drug resistance transporter
MDSPGYAADQAAKDPALLLSHRRKMEILFAILLGIFLSALDQTIVGTALPRIVADLNGTNELYTWVVTIYLLTATITGVFYGKLSDLYGRRLMLLVGVTVFLLGSALSGLSWNMESLIFFRGLQGIGAGALFPISLAVIGDLFTPAERGKYQGLFGAIFGLSSIIGPLLGGWLTDNGPGRLLGISGLTSWHWIFYVNLPIGAVTLYIIYKYLPTVRGQGSHRSLDYLGAVVFTAAVSALMIGLTNKASADWSSVWVGGLIAVSLVLGAVFLFIESRAAEPIIPLDLFRNRGYSVTILAVFLAGIGFFGSIIFLPRWFQFVKGVDPTDSGLQILALLAGVILSSIVSGILVSRTGRYKMISIVALSTMAIGILLLTGLRAETDLPILWIWMFVTGLGIGPSLSVFTIVIQSVVPFDKLGVATGSLTFFRQIGGSVGLAIVGTIFGSSFADKLVPQLQAAGVPPDVATQIAAQAATGGGSQLTAAGTDLNQVLAQFLPPDLIPKVIAGLHEAFSLAIADTFWFGLGATVLALVAVVVALPEVPLRGMVPRGAKATGRPVEPLPIAE